jgi:hypothetical protein
MLWLASHLLKSQHLLPPKSLRLPNLIHRKLDEDGFGYPASAQNFFFSLPLLGKCKFNVHHSKQYLC